MGLLVLALLISVSMVTDPAGGLAALTPFITITLSLIALIKPKAGLFALVPLVIWVDEYKRLAVYFGGAYSFTVMQTLAMPFVVLAALNAGYLLNGLFGRIKLEGLSLLFFLIALIAGVGVFFTMDGTWMEKGQRAANIAGYITLVPIAYSYLKTFDDWRKFFALQVIFALPAAAWALKQYYIGFDQIEWVYAKSGLSRVHYAQMLLMENPRVFGFFGSASALGCASIYCSFAWWHALRYKKARFFWIFAGSLLMWTLVVSTQRTALIYPVFVLIATFAFRTRARTLLLYGTALSLFVLAVAKSDYILAKGLDDVNNAIASDSEWGDQVLKVSTFSDRIRGWQRLKRADTYSLFGTGEGPTSNLAKYDVSADTYNHDVINKILITVGVVGFLAILIPGGMILVYLHRAAFRATDRQTRNDAAFALALALPMVGLSFIGGDNFNANPINIQIWTSFAGVMICRKLIRRGSGNLIASQPRNVAPVRVASPQSTGITA